MLYHNRTQQIMDTLLNVAIVVLLILIGISAWYSDTATAVGLLITLAALLLVFLYLKALKVLALKRKFIIIQEMFTAGMLIFFSIKYLHHVATADEAAAIKNERKKMDKIYEKSRYHLTIPMIVSAIKAFSDIKKIKNTIQDEVKGFSNIENYNLENAEKLANEANAFVAKMQEISHIFMRGFGSKPLQFDEAVSDMDKKTPRARQAKSRKASSKKRSKKRA